MSSSVTSHRPEELHAKRVLHASGGRDRATLSTVTATMKRTVKIPGPAHPIAIVPNPRRVVVTVGGEEIVNTTGALTLREADYPPIFYIPRRDVAMDRLQRSTTTTYCPYKGEASYFSILSGGARSVDAIWTYETPHDAVAAIRDYLAFYPDRVDAVEERPA